MYGKVLLIIILSATHILLGFVSFIIGIFSSIQSLIWVAHTVSPVFSGVFFILSGCFGLAMFKHRSQYSILCFAAVNAITLITGVINMQLLRFGLINYTTLGKTFQKENKDLNIIVAMCVDGCECIVCMLSLLISFKLNHDAKNNRFKSARKEGAFFVQIISDKDIVVVQSKQTATAKLQQQQSGRLSATGGALIGSESYTNSNTLRFAAAANGGTHHMNGIHSPLLANTPSPVNGGGGGEGGVGAMKSLSAATIINHHQSNYSSSKTDAV